MEYCIQWSIAIKNKIENGADALFKKYIYVNFFLGISFQK